MCRRGELGFPGVERRAAPRAAHEASVDLLCSCASSLCSRHLKIAVRACERARVFFTSLIIHQEQGFYIYICFSYAIFTCPGHNPVCNQRREVQTSLSFFPPHPSFQKAALLAHNAWLELPQPFQQKITMDPVCK